ncbi:unnamed protein product [Somion occarium]|uniref:HIG1 domain-containing protein n=1 Tax=Somion occarium TaxID=3059160 RepID=A0ABP1DPR2_9APHY
MSTQNVGSSGRVVPNSESFTQVVARRSKENPFVPLGCAATVLALVMAMRQSRANHKTFNYWLRARVVAQGFTVAALVGGSYMLKQQSDAQKAQEEANATLQKEKEREAFQDRLKAAEENYQLEGDWAAQSGSSTNSGGGAWGFGLFGKSLERSSGQTQQSTSPFSPVPPEDSAPAPTPGEQLAPSRSKSFWKRIGFGSSGDKKS